ncbi:hypothetical protein H6S82_24050 [Planktothrix sp. FACHB-1355]|uniref:Response regulatory domain-containing protein n=1 Tax=Aerosakkonema funiforme FACHB-1375 TaxID=2949571 RepID=A0A926VKD7_9CYAN|nr:MULTISPECIES: hypothetical protein [Oscillatoriales]MBD2185430.1 hypothetical protein [Aerosakkonema funiforme FACHB-1375]MBD3561893.1 hypothetical protein [Planktothrix sp. FACHB-1355]
MAKIRHRKRNSFSWYQFIFITAQNNQDVQRLGGILGANSYRAKPFATAQLLGAIALPQIAELVLGGQML